MQLVLAPSEVCFNSYCGALLWNFMKNFPWQRNKNCLFISFVSQMRKAVNCFTCLNFSKARRHDAICVETWSHSSLQLINCIGLCEAISPKLSRKLKFLTQYFSFICSRSIRINRQFLVARKQHFPYLASYIHIFWVHFTFLKSYSKQVLDLDTILIWDHNFLFYFYITKSHITKITKFSTTFRIGLCIFRCIFPITVFLSISSLAKKYLMTRFETYYWKSNKYVNKKNWKSFQNQKTTHIRDKQSKCIVISN